MGLIKTSGIVTKTTKYGDSSLIVTLLTKDFGKISAIANGARTKKSQLIGGLQLFAFSEIVMYKSKSKKGLYHLDEMTVIESFAELRYDLLKMAYASYFAEAANGALVEDSVDEGVLRLLLNCLFVLEKGDIPYEKIKTVFEWRLASESGYSPLLDFCSVCGEAFEKGRILPQNGTAVCEKCESDNGYSLSNGMVRIVDYISKCDSRQLFSFDSSDSAINYLSEISERYLKIQLDKEFPTLEYLKKVKALESNNEKTN